MLETPYPAILRYIQLIRIPTSSTTGSVEELEVYKTLSLSSWTASDSPNRFYLNIPDSPGA